MNSYVQSLNVTFIAIIDCGASIDHMYGAIQYTWDFGNDVIKMTSSPLITHAYQFKGTYNFSVLASNNVSQINYTGQVHIETGI